MPLRKTLCHRRKIRSPNSGGVSRQFRIFAHAPSAVPCASTVGRLARSGATARRGPRVSHPTTAPRGTGSCSWAPSDCLSGRPSMSVRTLRTQRSRARRPEIPCCRPHTREGLHTRRDTRPSCRATWSRDASEESEITTQNPVLQDCYSLRFLRGIPRDQLQRDRLPDTYAAAVPGAARSAEDR